MIVGPIEWNPLNPVKLKDESLFVALSWWGDDDEPPTKLPLSNSRQSTTYFKVTRSMKTLQCYLTDMGALTLTLCDKNDTVIGKVVLFMKKISRKISILKLSRTFQLNITL